jgi:eukaryotic-like serine/threonine-protein kinase
LRADLKRLKRETASGRVGAGLAPPSPVDVGTGLVHAHAGHPQGAPLRYWARWLAGSLAVILGGLAIAWFAWRHGANRPEPVERQLTTNSSELAVWAAAISPDGRHLAYADDTGIHLKVISTAEAHDLPAPAGFTTNLAWFPDGDKLLASVVGANGPDEPSLWSISTLGGTSQKLRDDARDGSVLPDGSGIVFVTGSQEQVWQMGPEGEDARKLMDALEGEHFARPTVARGRLWYERMHGVLHEFGVPGDLESRDLKGGSPSTAVSSLDDTSVCVLLPNGHLIYSRRDQPKLYQGGSLWEVQADLHTGLAKGEARRVGNWPDFEISALSATADGRRLAFLRQQTEQYSIYVGDVSENGLGVSNPYRLTFSDSLNHAYAWTPDSKSVLFDSNRNGTFDIFRQALNQRTPERLVSGPGGGERPVMAPDGVSVLYLTAGSPDRIMRVPLSGGPPLSLEAADDHYHQIRCARTTNVCVVSDWKPKRAVLYWLDPAKGKGPELLRIDAHGGEVAWDLSPDGASLGFINGDAGHQDLQIEVHSVAGGANREINVAGLSRDGGFIRWAADGKGWYVTVESASGSRLFKIDLAGKATQLMQETPWADAIPSPDGRHVALRRRMTTGNVWMLENF